MDDDVAMLENTQTYNQNLIKHVCGTFETPKRPGKSLETYLFALFNEDLKAERLNKTLFLKVGQLRDFQLSTILSASIAKQSVVALAAPGIGKKLGLRGSTPCLPLLQFLWSLVKQSTRLIRGEKILKIEYLLAVIGCRTVCLEIRGAMGRIADKLFQPIR
ncbi:hypothetical protein Syun_000977 [Stephania yunnanensis]|uniref:Uncharacterized protein n=1 Tax=Stephania yunnanensis TaxID=152371 RepID=A0AAP0LCU9_9MAGN